MTVTLDYYNQNARDFVDSTIGVDFTSVQERFMGLLDSGARILDFGCGSGRDTKYFLEHGLLVDATDGSDELCRLASEYTGITVRRMLFNELDAVALYDGVWACSSILHVGKAELPGILNLIARALKPRGILYTSFKYGDYDGLRNGRHFSDFTSESFDEFLRYVGDFTVEDRWITGDVRPGRGDERWLNLILRKI